MTRAPRRGRHRRRTAGIVAAALACGLVACGAPEPPLPAAAPRPPTTSAARGTPVPAPVAAAAPAAPRPARRPAGATAPLALAVPSLGIATGPLIPLGLLDDGTLEVPPDASGVGWYVHSPIPGNPGPAVIAAHVDYAGRLGVFAHLGRLQPGAAVTVTRPDGTPARFTVYRVQRYPKTSFPAGAVYGDTAGPELRLITCGGEFDAATGNYRDNVVAFARAA